MKCSKHPKYKGIKIPKETKRFYLGCTTCWDIWHEVHPGYHENVKVGDRVEITGNIPFSLKDRKNKNGIITNINGGYHLIRPMWCNWETELYRGEFRKI
ncbi:hypothetical protein LCGC14_1789680 [marine sediment metagenome]|uniref:Uncharacterized protein n=1 Tax=marine sediment metagenome TaxID=412755 RepID=A0A0F9JSH9_9ZZZZ